ncbi:MAG: xanthine dehydrogenase family protein molybdopterin-binding subunit [Pseudomonadota bacterium]
MNEAAMNDLGNQRFAIGQPVTRKEDPRLIRGEGRYTDDLHIDGEAHAYILRSDVAHAAITGIDVGDAKSMPGVLRVMTYEDLDKAGIGPLKSGMPLKNHDGSPMHTPPHPALAKDRVRYVGQPVACVIAETLAQARDAAEAIIVETNALDGVSQPEAALQPGSPKIHDDLPHNLCLDWQFGDAAAVEQAFGKAAHVTKMRIINNRVVVASMEPRGLIVEPKDGRLIIHIGCQGTFSMRSGMASALGLDEKNVRVMTYSVGGSFGMKAPVYPEYLPVGLAAQELGRPVRWFDDRSGAFLSDFHGRDSICDAALALDAEGNMLAVQVDVIGDAGAYAMAAGPMVPSASFNKNLPSVYRVPVQLVRTRVAFTNRTPTHAYRGAGRPEANYVMERLVEQAAREMKIDPIALRRRNFIKAEEMPRKSSAGIEYDSGEFDKVLDMALAQADFDGFTARQEASSQDGKLRGFGVATYCEITAPPGKEMGGLRFEENGRVTFITGTLNYGQGHDSSFAQVISQHLGVPFDVIDILQGDSDELIAGGGTGGSRSMIYSGAAALAVSDAVIEKGKQLAAHVLEAAPQDVTFASGRFTIAGTDRGIDIMDLARRVPTLTNLPAETPPSLDHELTVGDFASTCPNGVHTAEIEIDPDLGTVAITRFVAIDDFGNVVNPLLAAGQVHGGVVQGIGQALMENSVYSEDGQLLSGSFMDYCMPRADDSPEIEVEFHVVPATTNPLGAKGCGEAGVSGSCPAIINAIIDALEPLGITSIDMPATPEVIWQAIQSAQVKQAA